MFGYRRDDSRYTIEVIADERRPLDATSLAGSFSADEMWDYLVGSGAETEHLREVDGDAMFPVFITTFQEHIAAHGTDSVEPWFGQHYAVFDRLARAEDPLEVGLDALIEDVAGEPSNRVWSKPAALLATLVPERYPGIPMRVITLKIRPNPDHVTRQPTPTQLDLLMRIITELDQQEQESPLLRWLRASGHPVDWISWSNTPELWLVLEELFLLGVETLGTEQFQVGVNLDGTPIHQEQSVVRLWLPASMLQTPDLRTTAPVPSNVCSGPSERHRQFYPKGYSRSLTFSTDAERLEDLNEYIRRGVPEPHTYYDQATVWQGLMGLVGMMDDLDPVLDRLMPLLLDRRWDTIERYLCYSASNPHPGHIRLRQRFLSGEHDPLAAAYLRAQIVLKGEYVDPEDNTACDTEWFRGLPDDHRIDYLTVTSLSQSLSPQFINLLASPMDSVEILVLERPDLYDHPVGPPYQEHDEVYGLMAARTIAQNTSLSKLSSLYLTDMRVGDNALALLAESPHLKSLGVLWIGGGEQERGNNITDDGLEALAQSPIIKNLYNIDLSWNSVTADGLIELLDSPHMSHDVDHIDLSLNDIDQDEVDAIVADRPWLEDCNIVVV